MSDVTATSSRVLELLSLLQARRDWLGSELADRLEVSRRTIRRDAERLRVLGSSKTKGQLVVRETHLLGRVWAAPDPKCSNQPQEFEGVCPAGHHYPALFGVARNSSHRPFKAVVLFRPLGDLLYSSNHQPHMTHSA
jgi:biotin operon repressor